MNVEAQMMKKKYMQKMFMENERNEKQIEQLISDTFMSQRNYIMSGKDIRALTEDWPLLFSLVGMKAHFKLLTGVHISVDLRRPWPQNWPESLNIFSLVH